MNKSDPEESRIPINPAMFTQYNPRDPEQWEITTQRLTVLYLNIRRPEHPSLDTLYGCYSWINDRVNEENPGHGITPEYKDYFYTHDPHHFLMIIAYEFDRWHGLKEKHV